VVIQIYFEIPPYLLHIYYEAYEFFFENIDLFKLLKFERIISEYEKMYYTCIHIKDN